MARSSAALVCVGVLLFAQGTSHAGTNVRGTLWLSRQAQSRAEHAGAPIAQPGVTEAVVWIEALPAALERKLATPRHHWFFSHPKPAPIAVIEQRKLRFEPGVLTVPSGSQVAIANADKVYHNPFSVSAARRFDLGHHAPGHCDTLQLAKAGIINVHCEIYPDMVAYIVVTPNHAVARPDSAGRFALPRLPPGHYTLHAWHPLYDEIRVPFDVRKRGVVSLEPRF